MQWGLVVTTTDEVILCALAHPDDDPSDNSPLNVVATSFMLPTDNTRILTVKGTSTGRVFLGGDDGCVYEMMYELGDQQQYSAAIKLSVEEQLNEFYDGEGATVPNVIHDEGEAQSGQLLHLGKRAWSSLSGSDYGSPARKCAKVNRTDSVSGTIKSVVPDFVIRGASFLFGGAVAGGGRIEQMVVDEARGCLYTLSARGWICAYALKQKSSVTKTKEDGAYLAAVMDGVASTRLYLEAVARNQGFPPSSSSKNMGLITFPGGGASAQAGVGGMDGARAILKLAGGPANARPGTSSSDDVLKPVSIHVVSPTESNRITLVAVTAGGLRLYISSLVPSVINNGPDALAAPRYSSRPARNPFAPHNRLTLCHVRSPPPLSRSDQDLAADASGGVVGGILPRVRGKLARVDASVYDDGVFVSAVLGADPSRSTGISTGRSPAARRQQEEKVGDTIFATCTDVAARRIESTPASSSNDQNTATANLLMPLGGITESIAVAVSSFGGSSNNANVPGGIIYDIAVKTQRESAVVKLTANSSTPSDSELGAGFVPTYFPASEIRTRARALSSSQDYSRFNGGATFDGTSTAGATKSSPTAKTAMKVIGNVFTNILLSRPIRHGLSFDPPLENGNRNKYSLKKNYRISKRDASAGFSSTAGEGTPSGTSTRASPSSKTSRNPKSARLRKWLLQPATVPLNYLATQYYTKPKEMVALNPGGLHYFHFVPVLTSFTDALIAAGDSVAHDVAISSFFEAYGYKEACTMSLGLAIGGGPSKSSRDQISQRAVRAAVARALVPRLILIADSSTGRLSSGITSATDSFVPQGYEFRGSALCEGATALFARLVRPIWHKPAVVVTEGRSVKSRWSSKTTSTPAKVEILLDEATIEEIVHLLRGLMDIMKTVFSRAIKTVPGNAKQRQGSMMDLDDFDGDDNYLTRGLQYNSQPRGGNSGMSVQLSPNEADHFAQLIEERNLHSLYRLLSRVVQLLDLMSLLWRAQRMTDLREVDWGLLHGSTFAQLAQTSEGQDRLESLLNSLVTSSASGRTQTPVTSAQADQLANLFAEQCYLFFSPGSRFAYLGLRKAHEGLQQPVLSSSRTSFANQAAENLLQAASHWHSAPLVTGRILHTKGKETFHEIAALALEFGSPVAAAAEALMDLGDVSKVVEVCLTTAANFQGDRQTSRRTAGPFAAHRGYEFNWEQNLYHKRRDDTQQNGSSLSSRGLTNESPSRNIIAYGTDVTAKDAVETCYAIIFHHLSSLLDTKSDLADPMIEACSLAGEPFFLEAFFTHLLENNYAETLLRINIPVLDNWLKDRGDAELLWRYYDIQKRYGDGGQVALNKANDLQAKLSLEERIDWLSRAVNSFVNAREKRAFGMFETAENDNIAKKTEEATNSLRIAKIQKRILASIDSTKPDGVTPEMYDRLSKQLLPVTELFNEVAAKLSMFDECLLILHACQHDEVRTIETLWKNIICEQILPCATRDEETYRFLESFVADVKLGEQIKFIQPNGQGGQLTLFERAEWKESVAQRVVSLGKELFGTGADYVFPVNFLLSSLEGKWLLLPLSLYLP